MHRRREPRCNQPGLLGALIVLCLGSMAFACASPEPTALQTAVPPTQPATHTPTIAGNSGYLSAEDLAFVKQYFNGRLDRPVTVWLFTVIPEGESLQVFRAICRDLTLLDSRYHFEDRDFQNDSDLAAAFGLDKGPAVVIANGAGELPSAEDPTSRILRYYGIPEALLFATLIRDVADISAMTTELTPNTIRVLTQIEREVKLEMFFNAT